MNRVRVFLLVCLTLILVSAHVSAKDNPVTAKQTRIINGYFDCNGKKLSFSLPEGHGLTIKKTDGTAEYRLVPERLDNNHVSLALLDAESGQPVERFDTSLNGNLVRGTIVPISLALTGITIERNVDTERRLKVSETGEPGTDASCCIPCGSYIYCCTPSPGWCCSLECSTGGSCSACS